METKTPFFKRISFLVKNFFINYKSFTFIILIFTPLLYLAAVFYLYAWQVQVPGQTSAKRISINSAVYEKIIKKLQEKEINFQQEEFRTYLDPFK